MRVVGIFEKKNGNSDFSDINFYHSEVNWIPLVKIELKSYCLTIWSDEKIDYPDVCETDTAFCAIFGKSLDREGNNLKNSARIFMQKAKDFPNLVQGPIIGVYLNKVTSEFFIFRDRFGSKTIYWTKVQDRIFFANEIKFILQQNTNVNLETLYNFVSLNYRMVFGRTGTFYSEISEIPTACGCSFDKELRPQLFRYWMPPNSVLSLSEIEIQENFEKLFTKSLRGSLKESKNPIFYLSGGLDAPIVASATKEIMGDRLNTIGAIFPGFENYNEQIFIDDLVESISRNHIEINGSELDYGNLLNTNVKRHDQPILSATYLLFSHMLKIVDEFDFRSIFGGGGGDLVSQGCLEYQPYIFADYFYSFPKDFSFEMKNWVEKVGPFLRYWPNSENKMIDLIKKITKISESSIEARHNPDWIKSSSSIFDLELTRQFENSRDMPIEWDYATFRQIRLADEFFRQAIPTHFVEEININSYRNIVSFDPFWDLQLIEFGFALPLSSIFKNGFTKPLSRNFGKNILPKSILNRPDKTGLGVPIDLLFNNQILSELVMDFLSDDFAMCKLGFDKLKTKQLLNDLNAKDKLSIETYFWKICSVAAWYYAWV